MSSIDDAINRIQDIALSMTGVSVRSAPPYPIENVDPLPMVSAYLNGGSFNITNATVHHNFPIVAVEFHFARLNLRDTYTNINAAAVEFPQRLAGDPTLNGTVVTIVGGAESQIEYAVRPFKWNESIITQMLLFTIPLKLLKTPTT